MFHAWHNDVGYTIRLYTDAALESVLTLETPNGHIEVIRRYAYSERDLALWHAEVLSVAMGAQELDHA